MQNHLTHFHISIIKINHSHIYFSALSCPYYIIARTHIFFICCREWHKNICHRYHFWFTYFLYLCQSSKFKNHWTIKIYYMWCASHPSSLHFIFLSMIVYCIVESEENVQVMVTIAERMKMVRDIQDVFQ